MKKRTWDRWAAVVVIVGVIIFGGFWLVGCLPHQQQQAGEFAKGAGEAVGAVAPFLPGPLGGIAAAGATVLTLVGGLFAGRAKATAMAAGGQGAVAAMNPLTKLLSERKWLFPTIGALIASGNAAGAWHVDQEKMWTLLAALGLPAGAEFAKDAMVKPPPPAEPKA